MLNSINKYSTYIYAILSFASLAFMAKTELYCVESISISDSTSFKAEHAEQISLLEKHIQYYKDFPKPGIIFADFLPILRNAQALELCINLLHKKYELSNIDLIVGLESRGFLIGAPLAMKLNVGFVPMRKPGKLPSKTLSITYQKEYGTDTIEISEDAIKANQRVLIIDDLLATGGTARAAIELVKKAGGIPVEFATILQVKELACKANLEIPWFNLIN